MNSSNGTKAVMAVLQLIAILVGIGVGVWVFSLVTG
jgi:hypothetical protein